jgi:hypothetical protein
MAGKPKIVGYALNVGFVLSFLWARHSRPQRAI